MVWYCIIQIILYHMILIINDILFHILDYFWNCHVFKYNIKQNYTDFMYKIQNHMKQYYVEWY